MYIFAISLFSIFAYFEVFNREMMEKYKSLFLFICYVFLIFHDGFRWETGTDWLSYYDFFEKLTIEYSIEDSDFEIGYTLFMYLIRLVTDNYTVYLIIHAIFFYTCFFYCITKISKYPFVSILVFYMITLPYLGMNRQFLSMAIFSVGLVFLLKGQRLKFILSIAIAFLFHRTAIIGLCALLCSHRIKPIWIVSFICIALIVSLSGIVNKAGMALVGINFSGDIGSKLDFYTNGGGGSKVSLVSTLLSLIKKFVWLGFLLVFRKKVDGKDQTYYTLLNIYILGCILYLIFNNTILQVFVSRALLFFNITEIFIIPYALTIFKQNYGKLIIMFILSIYCFINIKKGFDNYAIYGMKDLFEPYKGVFINTNYKRQYH